MLAEQIIWFGFIAGGLCLFIATRGRSQQRIGSAVSTSPKSSADPNTILDKSGNHNNSGNKDKDKDQSLFQTSDSGKPTNGITENIRQIGLIQRDEFDAFYQPIIDKVQQYSLALGEPRIERMYFETLYKGLRKRRSAIFEYGSSEADQAKRAAWTFALFASLSIRYVVILYRRYDIYSNGELRVEPALETTESLKICHKQKCKNKTNDFPASTLNLHLIDKILPPAMIRTLSDFGLYPSLVNAVTGLYFQSSSPFYQIIEQVEDFVHQRMDKNPSTFDQTLDIVLTTIQQNVISKNTIHSLVFEGTEGLLVDRCILWELFRAYNVAETAPLSKNAFEIQLCTQKELTSQLEQIISYTVLIDSDHQEETEFVTLQLHNCFALPYQQIPKYQPTKHLRIEHSIENRQVCAGEEETDVITAPDQKVKVQRQALKATETIVNTGENNDDKAAGGQSTKQVSVRELFSN